ncbi:MAG: type II toxin-antitoxin system HicA family toxin [Desulfohalobiaceae bacterium]
MVRYDKLLLKIIHGTSDANIGFYELCNLLKRLGFEERIRGSHHIFRKKGIEEKINLQKDDGKAKPYQVQQVRSVLIRYKLTGDI